MHHKISEAEWRQIRRLGLVDDPAMSWQEFRDIASEHLKGLRNFFEEENRERAGEMLSKVVVNEVREQPDDSPHVHVNHGVLSPRTAARARALNALDQLHLGPKAWGRASRTITSRVEPTGGEDKTQPRWVIRLQIEAWVPAEEVKQIYQDRQRELVADQVSPKVQPQTYEVVRFVWGQMLVHGKRPSWPKLCDWWNQRNPKEVHFKNWRALRTCFLRGEKATTPRYVDSADDIIRRARQLKEWRENPPSIGLQPPPPLSNSDRHYV